MLPLLRQLNVAKATTCLARVISSNNDYITFKHVYQIIIFHARQTDWLGGRENYPADSAGKFISRQTY
jgi:hypothetical protein